MLLRSHNVALVCLMLFVKKKGALLGDVKRSILHTMTYYRRNVEEILIFFKAEIAI